jgi:hypothetical protein
MKAAIESTEAAKAAKTAYMQDNVKFEVAPVD